MQVPQRHYGTADAPPPQMHFATNVPQPQQSQMHSFNQPPQGNLGNAGYPIAAGSGNVVNPIAPGRALQQPVRPSMGTQQYAAATPSSSTVSSSISGMPSAVVPQSQSSQQNTHQRRVLTPSAKQALTKAVLSSLHSPTGTIDPSLMAEAKAVTGLPTATILNAARLAREREHKKRQERQNQQRQEQQQQQRQHLAEQNRQQELHRQRQRQYQQYEANRAVTAAHQQHVAGGGHSYPHHGPQHHGQQHHGQQHHGQQHPGIPKAAPYRAHHSATTAGKLKYPSQVMKPAAASSGTPPPQQKQREQLQQKKPKPPHRAQQAKEQQSTLSSSASAGLARAADIVAARAKEAERKAADQAETLKWRRLHYGLFSASRDGSSISSSSNFQPIAGTLGAMVRCSETRQAGGELMDYVLDGLNLNVQDSVDQSDADKQDDDDAWKEEAANIQKSLLAKQVFQSANDNGTGFTKESRSSPKYRKSRSSARVVSPDRRMFTSEASKALLSPDDFKRLKVEPRKETKGLERNLRKARQTTADALVKKHRDLGKAMATHQTDFVRHHRYRKAAIHRLVKSVRDKLDGEEKLKEKATIEAEKARIAALRANDMTAYTKMLEDTRNERLKFLLDKTDECINEISGLLQDERTSDGTDPSGSSTAASTLASQGTSSYYASAHVKSEEVKQPSILEFGTLKEYQLGGLKWMVSLYNNRLNGILADEMGLGKTVQTIALIAYLLESKGNRGPYLVIVPLSTLSNWVNEFKRWCPSINLITYKGIPAVRKAIFRNEVREGHFNVLLTTYEYIIKDKASLRKIEWQYAIIDEGHRMKNAQSKFAVTLGTMYTTKNRLLLTGTPLQNNLPELWALLNFLLPTVFNSVENFDQWFNAPFSNFGGGIGGGGGGGGGGGEGEGNGDSLNNEERMLIIHRLHELLRPFMLRRLKSEVLDQLPDKVEKVLRCDLSSWQKTLYKQISATITDDGNNAPNSARGLNNVVMQLRKVCNHPYLFTPEGYYVNDDIIRTSGKFELLDRMLPKLKAAGHRVLMFSQMTQVMTILEDYFRYRGHKALSLSGSTSGDEREKRMDEFNAPDSPYFIFLLSTRAGGLGLNLATADTVIIFDSDWNPMMDLQAQDRAHRIGQKNTVSVFRLCTNSPVEEKILSRATEKLNMSELVVEAGKFDSSSVDQDNSKERMKMMEVLMTDFDKAPTVSNSLHSNEAEDDEDEETGEEDDSGNEINELLSTTEVDYERYCKFDAENPPGPGLRTDPNDIPDWIRYPQGKNAKKKEHMFDSNPIVEGKRSAATKTIAYDDHLTEKQFVRMMEKKAKEEEDAKARKRAEKKGGGASLKRKHESTESVIDEMPMTPLNGAGLPQPIRNKLVNMCKAIIAVKDPATKRRLSDIFRERPDREVYPDYYSIIERPIGINDVMKKVKKGGYAKVKEFYDDWQLIFQNALKYNGQDSWVTTDATKLRAELDRLIEKSKLLMEEEKARSSAILAEGETMMAESDQDDLDGGEKKEKQKPAAKPLRIKLSLKSMMGGSKQKKKADGDGERALKKARPARGTDTP